MRIARTLLACGATLIALAACSQSALVARAAVPETTRSTPAAVAPAAAPAVVAVAKPAAAQLDEVAGTIAGVSTIATTTVGPFPVYARPGAPHSFVHLANPNTLGAQLAFLVISRRPVWTRVYLPMRPNGSTGWVKTRMLKLYADPYALTLHLATHRLQVRRYGRLVETDPVATGAPSAPTPTGRYFLAYLVKLADPGGPYGPYAFGTSAFSTTYSTFNGGIAEVALHGTGEPQFIGQSVSHGCIRVNNSVIFRLAAELPAGTPLTIES